MNKNREITKSLNDIKEVRLIFSNKELRGNKMGELLKKWFTTRRSKNRRNRCMAKLRKGYLTLNNDMPVVEVG